jgi:hypothetical protein
MIVGRYIQRLNGQNQFSPPFPRGGQRVLVTAEVFAIIGSVSTRFNLAVQHKNEADTSWAQVGIVTIAVTIPGVTAISVGPLKEMLRFAYSVSHGVAPLRRDTVYFNIPPPTWQP